MTEQDLRTAWVVEPPKLTGKIQVYSPGCPEIERDWTSVQQYADAKTEVVESIIARAQAAKAGG